MAKSFLVLSLTLLTLTSCGTDEPAPPATADGGCSLGNTMAEIEQKLFRGPRCVGCHAKATLFPTSLDLVSDGLAARVVDKLAAADNPAKGKCAGRVLVPRDNPTGGLFVEKVEKSPPSCGDAMPQTLAPPTAGEIACVKLWATLAAGK